MAKEKALNEWHGMTRLLKIKREKSYYRTEQRERERKKERKKEDRSSRDSLYGGARNKERAEDNSFYSWRLR